MISPEILTKIRDVITIIVSIPIFYIPPTRPTQYIEQWINTRINPAMSEIDTLSFQLYNHTEAPQHIILEGLGVYYLPKWFFVFVLFDNTTFTHNIHTIGWSPIVIFWYHSTNKNDLEHYNTIWYNYTEQHFFYISLSLSFISLSPPHLSYWV